MNDTQIRCPECGNVIDAFVCTKCGEVLSITDQCRVIDLMMRIQVFNSQMSAKQGAA